MFDFIYNMSVRWIVIIRRDTGEYLVADPPHPRSWEWDDDPDEFFTDDLEKAETFATAIWAERYIYRCPPLCSLSDQATKRDHEHVIVYALPREDVGSGLAIVVSDVFRG